MQDFINLITFIAFLTGLITTVAIYRARVIKLQRSRRFWRQRSRQLEAKLNEVTRG